MSDEVVVFLGPTLPVAQAREVLDATYLPPAAQGDVYRASRRRPRAIALVDGYFASVPSVWHKELLWAMAQGTEVLGSSSMGALRASELDSLGMIGIGQVYRSFRDGVLTCDDEVTLAHAPAEAGYRPMSEALVNLRATVADARAAGVVGSDTATALLREAKTLFYPDRTIPRVVDATARAGASPEELERFVGWARCHRRDVKREDAVALLRHLRDRGPRPDPVAPATFDFPYTSLWEQLRRTAGHGPVGTVAGAAGGGDGTASVEPVLEEVKLQPPRWRELVEGALLRRLLVEEADRRRILPDDDAVAEAITRFRTDRGLWEVDDLRAWMRSHQVDSTDFLRLMREEAAVALLRPGLGTDTLPLMDVLRLTGAYAGAAERAARKDAVRRLVSADPPDAAVYAAAAAWHSERHGQLLDPAAPPDEQAALRRAVVVDYLAHVGVPGVDDVRS